MPAHETAPSGDRVDDWILIKTHKRAQEIVDELRHWYPKYEYQARGRNVYYAGPVNEMGLPFAFAAGMGVGMSKVAEGTKC